MSKRMTPSECIKQARKNARLTQEELGHLVGVTGVSIMRYEKGERVPDYATTCRLASALKLKIEDLMSETAKEWYDVGYETGHDFGYEEALVSDEQNYFMIDKRRKQKESPHLDTELRGYIDQWREYYEDEKKLSDEMIDHASSFDFDAVPRQDLEELLADTDLVISKYSQVIAGLEQIKREKPEVIEEFPDLDEDLDRMRNTRNLFVHIRDNELFESLNKLNQLGREKVKERIEELSEIPRYRAETTPQSTPASTEGKGITPPPDAPEKPPEGE